MKDVTFDTATATLDEPPLTANELRALRGLLQVARYDAPSKTLRLETDKAKILLRADGRVRIEARKVALVSHGSMTLNGAVIELN